GHIVEEELHRHLTQTEQANGFANRFIWLAVKRSKLIPNPLGVEQHLLDPLIEKLRDVVSFARMTPREIRRDLDAEALWSCIYLRLSEGRPGLLGAILARAEAHVMRLACLYALLDKKDHIAPVHLRAALAVWSYAEASARRIFGHRLGDPVADRI